MGGKYLVNGLECRLQDSQVIPNQAHRFRNFCLGPIPELFSARVSPHFQEIPKIMSTPLTQHYFLHFQEIHKIMSAKIQTWHSWRSQECQVWVLGKIISNHSWSCVKIVGRPDLTFFMHFLVLQQNMSRTKSGMGISKKVPDFAGLVRVPARF